MNVWNSHNMLSIIWGFSLMVKRQTNASAHVGSNPATSLLPKKNKKNFQFAIDISHDMWYNRYIRQEQQTNARIF